MEDDLTQDTKLRNSYTVLFVHGEEQNGDGLGSLLDAVMQVTAQSEDPQAMEGKTGKNQECGK